MEVDHWSKGQCVVIIGGTGMLRPAVRTLMERGISVVVVARRPLRGVAPQAQVNGGAYIPVEGEWSAPESLAEAVRDALEDRGISRSTVCGAIIWVHSPHRQSVLDELTRVLNPDARVLQLWGSAAQDPREVMDNEDRPDRPWRMRHLFLGYHRDSGGSRWLTDGEISRATVLAWDSGSEYVSAGQLDPWELRP